MWQWERPCGSREGPPIAHEAPWLASKGRGHACAEELGDDSHAGRARDEPGADAEDRERVDLHVRVLRLRQQLPLVDGDVGGVLLVDVEVLDDPFADEVGPLPRAGAQLVHVRLREAQLPAGVDDAQRPADACWHGDMAWR